MLSGFLHVIEVGCGDGFSLRIVKQEVRKLTITDYDPFFIEKFEDLKSEAWIIEAKLHDILKTLTIEKYDGLYYLHVMEHISIDQEEIFLKNIKKSLIHNSTAINGMPSIDSQVFASEGSRAGHVNCKTGRDLKKVLSQHLENVFFFSMNDDVIHTGYSPMAHYLIGLSVIIKYA